MIRALLLFLITVFVAGESIGQTGHHLPLADGDYRVGVFNIEHLSKNASRGFPELQGNNELSPRTNSDLEEIGRYLRDDVKVRCLVLTEIEADANDSTDQKPRSAQLDKIEEEMGDDWDYFLGRTGGKLRMGILFDKTKIKLKKIVNLNAKPFDVGGVDILDRDPFILWVTLLENGEEMNDFLLVGLHLKSRQFYIHNRMAAIAKVLGDLRYDSTRQDLGLPLSRDEMDIVIVGDFNDSEHKNRGFRYVCDYLEGSGFNHLGPEDDSYPATRVNGSQIDHIYVSNQMLGEGPVDAGTFWVHQVSRPDRRDYRKHYSDHFPVTVDITAVEDGD